MKTATGHTMPLPYYGIHSDNGISYLYQDTCPLGWEFIGLAKRSSQTVKHLKNQCSHTVNVNLATRKLSNNHWNKFKSLVSDPLVQAMLPIPNGHTYFFDQSQLTDSTHWLSCLERLSSPLHAWVRPLWSESPNVVMRQLKMTNIHPMVLTDIGSNEHETALRLAEANKTTPRTLILSGESNLILPKHVKKLTTNLDSLMVLQELISLPLEHIGSYIIAQHCKGVNPFTVAA